METTRALKALVRTLAIAMVAIVCLFAVGCADPRIVFTSPTPKLTGRDLLFGNAFVLPPGQTTPVAISTAYGPAKPCGHMSDGRLVLTIDTELGGNDIYFADPTTGAVLNQIVGSQRDEECVAVTQNDTIIYQVSYGTDRDLYAIPGGTAVAVPVATTAQDEYFLAAAPDGRIIFARRSYITPFAYDILSIPVGAHDATMLAQVFPPGNRPPMFNAVTSDNRVIFSEYLEYQQDSASLDIFSVKTDGTDPKVIAEDTLGRGDERFCVVTADNRVLYTDRYAITVNGVGRRIGDLYIVNADGNNTVALTPGVSHDNNICRGVTSFNTVVFSRESDLDYDERGPDRLYTMAADGQSQPVLIADSKDTWDVTATNYFETATPTGGIIFTTSTRRSVPGGNEFARTLNSVSADGSNSVVLTDNVNVVFSATPSGRVIYNAQVSANGTGAYNLFSVPVAGGAAPTQFSSSPNEDYVNFTY